MSVHGVIRHRRMTASQVAGLHIDIFISERMHFFKALLKNLNKNTRHLLSFGKCLFSFTIPEPSEERVSRHPLPQLHILISK